MAKPFSALQARNKYGEDTADRIPEIEKMFNLAVDWRQPDWASQDRTWKARRFCAGSLPMA
jgi:hypothetical protein